MVPQPRASSVGARRTTRSTFALAEYNAGPSNALEVGRPDAAAGPCRLHGTHHLPSTRKYIEVDPGQARPVPAIVREQPLVPRGFRRSRVGDAGAVRSVKLRTWQARRAASRLALEALRSIIGAPAVGRSRSCGQDLGQERLLRTVAAMGGKKITGSQPAVAARLKPGPEAQPTVCRTSQCRWAR